MGLFDKIKNALFEVEYVEVEDKPKKEKPEKHVEEEPMEEILDEKPIAKKIVLPGKREDRIEHLQEEELIDQDFESRPKDDSFKENNNSSFKFLDDSDFEVEEEPKIIETHDEVESLEEVVPSIPTSVPITEPTPVLNTSYSGVSPIQNVEPYTSSIASTYKVKERESRPYGMDPSYHVAIREYGSYENKDDKGYFKPSPIISPIYGILDKNYSKDDVVAKKDIRITSYSRTNMNLDDIRNKAYGKNVEEILDEKVEEKPVEVPQKEDNLLVDLSDEKERPEVKEITVGDAMEYFQDLGLEYNVDYVDASNKNAPQKKEEDLTQEIEENLGEEEPPKEEIKEEPKKKRVKEKVEEKEVKEDKKTVEVIDEQPDKVEDTISDDDNLFDLIDSMYKDS